MTSTTATTIPLKKTKTTWLLWFFLGLLFGAHRMYLNRMGSGLLICSLGILTLVMFTVYIGVGTLIIGAVWWIVDAFLLNKMIAKENALIASGAYEDL